MSKEDPSSFTTFTEYRREQRATEAAGKGREHSAVNDVKDERAWPSQRKHLTVSR